MTISMNLLPCLAAGSLALVGLIAALAALRAARGLQARYLGAEASLAAVRRELELLTTMHAKTGRRVRRIEEEYSGVTERVDQVEQRGAHQSFAEAISSARRGADAGRLSQQFGLSRGEADLVARLHGRKRA